MIQAADDDNSYSDHKDYRAPVSLERFAIVLDEEPVTLHPCPDASPCSAPRRRVRIWRICAKDYRALAILGMGPGLAAGRPRSGKVSRFQVHSRREFLHETSRSKENQ